MYLFAEGTMVDSDVQSRLVQGQTMVPVRVVAETLGAGVLFDPAESAATVQAAGVNLRFTSGSGLAILNERAVPLSVPAGIVDGVFVVPLRPIVQALGLFVAWDQVGHIAAVSRIGFPSIPPLQPPPQFSGEDVDLLARLISAEANDEPYEGLVAVGAVVMNRMRSREYAGSLREVIFRGGQFGGTRLALFKRTPGPEYVRAAIEAMNGWDPTEGALYFFNPARSSSQSMRRRPVAVVIGQHVFTK